MKLLLASLLLITGCTKSIERSEPKHREPSSSAKVYKPTGEWTIKSEGDIPDIGKVTTKDGVITWDLQGAILDGDKQKGDCDQNENQEPLFRAKVTLNLKNGFIRNAKNAATFESPDSSVDRVTWLNVCEDALATGKEAKNFTVTNNETIGRKGNDKAFQFNQASGLRVTGNMIYNTVTGMRIGKDGYNKVSETAYVGDNKFISVDTAYHISSITVKELSKSTYEGVNTEFKFANGAVKK